MSPWRAFIESNGRLFQGIAAIVAIAGSMGVVAAVKTSLPASKNDVARQRVEIDLEIAEERSARIAYQRSDSLDRLRLRREMNNGLELLGNIAMAPGSPEARAAQIKLRRARRFSFSGEDDR